jgi:hypothetical protein
MIVKGKLNLFQLQALDFFADALLTKQLKRHIIVNVKFLKKMDCLGLTDVEDFNVAGKPREFNIEVYRKQSAEEIILTLAHEFVHLSQYCRGDLNPEMTVWRGEKVNADEIPYHEQPWEIEAEVISHIIFNEYKEKLNG